MLFQDIPSGMPFTYKGKQYFKHSHNFATPSGKDAPPHLFIGVEECVLGSVKHTEEPAGSGEQ